MRPASPTLESTESRGIDSMLVLILGVALVLRVFESMRAPLWYDELYSLLASSRPLNEVLAIARADVHPPLHFLLTWCWRVFGDQDLAVRSLSIVCGMGGLVATYALARAQFGRNAARVAVLLLALHPWHIYVSQEARAYALLWLALTLSSLGAWRWRAKSQRRDAVLFVVAAGVALWTHYLAGLVLALQFLWGVVALVREPRRLTAWVVLHLGVAALFAPQIPTLWAQFHRVGNDHWMQRPDLAALVDVARRFAFTSIWLLPLLLVLALLPLARPKARMAAAFAWVVGPLAVLACWYLGTHGVRLFGVKYVLFALPLFLTLVAAGIVGLPGRASGPIVAAILAVLALRSDLLREPQPEAAALALARTHLATRAQVGDMVFHADTHTLLFAQHYLPNLRHRLLLGSQRLPYYEGGLLVADSSRASAAELLTFHAAGGRWFAMAARPAGLDTRAARAQFDTLAASRISTLGVVTVWDGMRH